MSFDLVHGRRNLCSLQQVFGRLNGEIADADATDLACSHELLQNSPSVCDRDVGYEEALRHRVDRCEGFVGVLEGDGPVDLCVIS